MLAKDVLGDPVLAADPNFATNVERVKRRPETDGKSVYALAGDGTVTVIDEVSGRVALKTETKKRFSGGIEVGETLKISASGSFQGCNVTDATGQ